MINLDLTQPQRGTLKADFDCTDILKELFDNNFSSLSIDKSEKLIDIIRSRYDLVNGLDSKHTNTKKSMLRLANELENKINSPEP